MERFDYGSRETNGQRCSYYATRDDYVPVAVDCTALVKAPWIHARITYEFLERTAASDALLSIRAQHPTATIDRAPITYCDQEPHYYGPGVAPDFAGDPRNAPLRLTTRMTRPCHQLATERAFHPVQRVLAAARNFAQPSHSDFGGRVRGSCQPVGWTCLAIPGCVRRLPIGAPIR